MQTSNRVLIVAPETGLTDQEWLTRCALNWLGDHYVLRWDWNSVTKQANGFEVIGEGGIQATVMLSDRAVSS